MNDPRTKKIIIRKFYDLCNTFTINEWHIPNEIIEYYSVIYEGDIVAYFWISNNSSDGVQFLTPMDVPIIEFILQEMRIRSMKQNGVAV